MRILDEVSHGLYVYCSTYSQIIKKIMKSHEIFIIYLYLFFDHFSAFKVLRRQEFDEFAQCPHCIIISFHFPLTWYEASNWEDSLDVDL